MAKNNVINNAAYALTVDTSITSTLGNITATQGDFIATLGNFTATHGNITATLGNIVLTNGSFTVGVANGTDGQVLIANTATGKPAWASISAGSGISLTPGANTLSIASTAPFTWTTIGADGALAANTGYIDTKAGLLTVSLPATAAVGTTLILQGLGAGGWKLTQAALQQVIMGNQASTIGIAGYIASSNANDSISLVCTTANLIWSTYSAVGNLTVV
jgi:hypothetical protein